MKNLKSLLILIVVMISSTVLAQEYKEFEWLVGDSLKFRQELIEQEDVLNEILEDEVWAGKYILKINEEAMKRFELGKVGKDFLGYIKYTVKKRPKKKDKPSLHKIKDTMMFLGLSVTMADSYVFAYAKLQKHKKLRRFLNSKDDAIGKEKNMFKKAQKDFFSFKNRKYIRRAIKVYKRHYLPRKAEIDAQDEEFKKIDEIIQMSYMYEKLSKMRFIDKVAQFFGVLGKRIGNSFKVHGDFWNKVGNGIVYGISKGFGNSVGMLQSRHGKLFMNHEFMKEVKAEMQPLDMLFEKTPFRATDRFIPGYYGHAAIYIGNEAQLKELGVWDHPVVQKFHMDIKLGKTIVEALRPGVQINTFRHFTDIDDFALVRRRFEMTNEDIADHIVRALSQVGKKYDFGFNAEVPDTIVCSELHYTVWRDIQFETTRILGRETIDVDQVVIQATSGMPFEPIMMYLDGKKIEHNIQAVYDMILEEGEYNPSKVRFLQAEKPTDEAELSAVN